MDSRSSKILMGLKHGILRHCLEELIQRTSDMEVAEVAVNKEELVEKIKRQAHDVVLLDLSLADESVLDLITYLKRGQPDVRILMTGGSLDGHLAYRLLRESVAGILTILDGPPELFAAIHRVAHGGKYVSPLLAEELASYLDSDLVEAPHELLSNREFQVLCLIASGKMQSEIAQSLSISTSSVNTYRGRILEKMKMKSSVDLTRYALKAGLID